MPIVKLLPDQQPNTTTTVPDEIKAPSKSIFTALVPENTSASLLQYTEGFPWSVNYYGQILNSNNTLENFDPTTPNLTQPYYKVNKLTLQVDSPLSSSYDEATGITSVRGSAITPYSLVPNVGDVFIAQVDTGEDAIFHITSVIRKTFRKDTLYEISYILYSYTSESTSFIEALEGRIQQTYFFDTSSNFFNRNTLIKPSVKEAIDRLELFMEESQEFYFSNFIQGSHSTLMIPGVRSVLYDPLLINFLLQTIEYSRMARYGLALHTYSSRLVDQHSILTALVKKSPSILKYANKQYIFISSSDLLNKARLGSLVHAQIDCILYPTNPKLDKELRLDDYPITSSGYNLPVDTTNYSNLTIEATTTDNTTIDKPILHTPFVNNYYIVSENFYNYIQDNSTFSSISFTELLIYRFIHSLGIAKEDLAVAVADYLNWHPVQQLYLLPVYWHLINAN